MTEAALLRDLEHLKSHPRPQGRKLKPSTMANHNRRKERSLMTKTFINPNAKAKTGYAIVIKEDNKVVKTVLIEEYDPNNAKSLKLPENPSNRKYFSIEKIGTGIELTYKESKTLGPRGSSKKLEDYMTDEEKKIVEEIMNKCKERKANDKPKELTPLEKAKRMLEKYQKEVDTLMKKEEEETEETKETEEAKA